MYISVMTELQDRIYTMIQINASGFLCVELKDIQYQLDDINNDAYMDVLDGLENVTMDYSDRYLDMNAVAGYSGTNVNGR